MKNPSDFSIKAIKRSKRKQYLVGIAGSLMLCITLFCIASVFTKPAAVPATAIPPTETPSPTETPTITPSPTLTQLPTDLPTVSAPTLIPLAACIPNNPREFAHVVKITDGDTIHVMLEGQEFSVRYIGIDTPEMSGDLDAQEAKDANSALVLDKDVIMVMDKSNTDHFGRLLRYIFVDGMFVNQQLVTDGWATSKRYSPDTACNGDFESAQSSAQTAQVGLWAPLAVPIVPQKAVDIPITTGGNCDPSYPGVCIPPAPPDLDCGDITFRRFQVLPPDPHNFDRDGDGIGCES